MYAGTEDLAAENNLSKRTLRYGPELLDAEVWIYKNMFCSIFQGVKGSTVVMMMILENKMKQV